MPPATLPAALAMARCHRIGLWSARSRHTPTVGRLSSSSILARYVPRKPADGKEAGHSRNEQGSLLYALLSRLLSRAGRDRQSGGEMPTRTFIAIELGDAARAALARTIAGLARELPGGSRASGRADRGPRAQRHEEHAAAGGRCVQPLGRLPPQPLRRGCGRIEARGAPRQTREQRETRTIWQRKTPSTWCRNTTSKS